MSLKLAAFVSDLIATVAFFSHAVSPNGRTPYRGISVADQPAINLSTFFHISTHSICSTRPNPLARLVHAVEFATIIANES